VFSYFGKLRNIAIHYYFLNFSCLQDMPRVQKVVKDILEELKDGVKLTNGKMVCFFFLIIVCFAKL